MTPREALENMKLGKRKVKDKSALPCEYCNGPVLPHVEHYYHDSYDRKIVVHKNCFNNWFNGLYETEEARMEVSNA